MPIVRHVYYSIFRVKEDGTLVSEQEDFTTEADAHEHADAQKDDSRDYIVLPLFVRKDVETKIVERSNRDHGLKTKNPKENQPKPVK